MTKKILLITGKVILGITIIWMALLLILEVALSPAVTSKIVNSIADNHLEGDLNYSKVRASMFKRFPSIYIDIEDFSITYPSDRFSGQKQTSPQGWLLYQGCGQTSDTLASFKSFKASLRMFPLICGKIKIPSLILDSPRIFAHQYNDEQSNWEIVRHSVDSTSKHTDSTAWTPSISLGKISLNNYPHIVYTDSKDTLYALLRLKSLDFNGRIANRKIRHNKIRLNVDSLTAAGRLGQDTIAFRLESMKVDETGKGLELQAKARTLIATHSLGRINIPIDLDGKISFPKDSIFAVSIEDFYADVANIPIHIDTELDFHKHHLYIKGTAGVDNCNLNGLLKGILINIIPDTEHFSTTSRLNLNIDCDGKYTYQDGTLPRLSLSAQIPESKVYHKGFDEEISLALDLSAQIDDYGIINAQLGKAVISTEGLGINLTGKTYNLLGDDPKLNFSGKMDADLPELVRFIPDSLGVQIAGKMKAEIEGNAYLSQINIYNFSDANMKGYLYGEGIRLDIPTSSIKGYLGKLDILLGPEDMKSRSDTTTSRRMLAIEAHIDSTNFNYGNLAAEGSKLSLLAKSSAEILKGGENIHHFGGVLNAGRIRVDDGKGSRLHFRNTSNGFQIVPDKNNSKAPVLTFTSRNKAISLKSGVQRAGLKDAKIIASANMNFEKLSHRKRGEKKPGVQEWMQEEDFRKQDIDISLDEELAKYIKKWNIRGKVDIAGGFVASPYFPLKNRLNGLAGKFSSNEITIDRFNISAGNSEIGIDGKINGIRRMLAGRNGGMLYLDGNIRSQCLDIDQLIKAYNAGTRFDAQKNAARFESLTDEEFVEVIAIDSSEYTAVPISTIVVPGNINAKITLDTKNIKYSGLTIDSLKATGVMKERCIQITETEAKSNVGDIKFNGFYSTRSKSDIKAGFSVDFEDITAEKVIALMPSIDTLMPVLKSFEGLLNCEIAATTQLDTNMNIIMPSIDGIMRITGDDLAVKNNPMFKKLAKKLLFKNKKDGYIDHMSVEGMISDNVVEIFPFVLKMDRYTMAMSGIQNLDMSFKYHVSLIKSPFLIRLGLDISGDDFDDIKLRLGRAKYKNANIPVFSKVIDDTKVNLVSSIKNIFKKGVDTTMDDTRSIDLIVKKLLEAKYVRAVDQELEELSEEEAMKVAEEEIRQAASDSEENIIQENSNINHE